MGERTHTADGLPLIHPNGRQVVHFVTAIALLFAKNTEAGKDFLTLLLIQ